MVNYFKSKYKFWKKKPVGERILYSFVLVIFTIVAAFYLFIFYFSFISGLKTHDEIVLSPFSLPEIWMWKNYIEIFSYLNVAGHNFFGMTFNSLYFATLAPLISQLCTCLFAYTCTKYDFPCSKLFYPLILVMMTLPLYGTGGSTYLLIKRLGLIDSYAHIILAFGGMSANFLYYNAVYMGVSDTYGEAAVIDGANDFQIFWKIMFPQARGLFIAMFIMGWVSEWNNYSSILIYLPNLPTLAGGMYLCHNDMMYDVRFDMVYAGYTISMIPSLVLFAIFHDIMMNSVSIGGMKE